MTIYIYIYIHLLHSTVCDPGFSCIQQSLDLVLHYLTKWVSKNHKSLIYIVTRKVYFYPRTGFYFRTCERRGRLALDPLLVLVQSFFSQAYKDLAYYVRDINLGPDWPPLARGSKFHTIHTPTRSLSFFPLDNGRYGPIGLVVIILYCSMSATPVSRVIF